MRALRHAVLTIVATSLLGTAVGAQAAQVSAPAQVSLSASRQPSLALEVTAGASLAIADLQPGITEFPAPVGVRSQWDLSGAGTVTLVGYFGDPAHALAGPTASIGASEVEASIDGNGFLPFNGPAVGGAGVTGGSLALFQHAAATPSGSRHDAIQLRLNVLNPQLPAGVYAGTLNLRLVVQ